MKRPIFLFLSTVMLLTSSSCGLLTSAAKIPTGLLQALGRTAGVSSLTDSKPQPEEKNISIPTAETKTEEHSVE